MLTNKEIKQEAKDTVLWYLQNGIANSEQMIAHRIDSQTSEKHIETLRILEKIKQKVENDEI